MFSKSRIGVIGFVLLLALAAQRVDAQGDGAERARQAQHAKAVTIVRDDWGIAHIYGKTDADAVFGMIYAQCEDDFHRVETNYLNSLGRLAETEGEGKIWQDLRQKLFMDPQVLQAQYAASPGWLKSLMEAWADGLNFYLATHPETKPLVIRRFEPWMALSFPEGSIGGDIERVDLRQLEAFYSTPVAALVRPEVARLEDWNDRLPTGSNGIVIAPGKTRDGHALLLINPHTSFYFRSELQMSSEEGLQAYGAVTWGQFFIYQGFNSRAGWMHTSSGVDAVDQYLETVTRKEGRFYYKHGSEELPVAERQITVPYKTAQGMAQRTFTVYYTGHGNERPSPVVREQDGKWVSIQLMQRPVEALEQSYSRTKAMKYAEYAKTMELRANSSNNTLFADADGDIAYWHGNFIPKRDTRFDFTRPVDGSDPAADWHGMMTVAETPHLLNPKSGYVFNVNDSPWNGAGESSLKQKDFPVYVETHMETDRGLHAMRLLEGKSGFTLDSLMASAYDSYLPWFSITVPVVVKDWEALGADSALKGALKEQVALLRGWDLRWGVASEATSLGVFWGEELDREVSEAAKAAHLRTDEYVAQRLQPEQRLQALNKACARMTELYGTWKKPWGEINRFQRLTGDIVQPFSDAGPSLPVGFTSSRWGSLAAFETAKTPVTKERYGISGNSFVAVVEFGDKVRARAVTAGGESGHPGDKHFKDEAERYAEGDLREVYFYPEQVRAHAERTYHPGQ
jgi:acyl-homoserine lactone acylase PvdQ